MLEQERVEEDYGVEVVVDAFDDNVGEIFVLVCEQAQYVL